MLSAPVTFDLVSEIVIVDAIWRVSNNIIKGRDKVRDKITGLGIISLTWSMILLGLGGCHSFHFSAGLFHVQDLGFGLWELNWNSPHRG